MEVPAALQASLDATKVSYKQLGKSGLRVSVPILGAMSFGDKRWADWVVEEKEALEILKAAYDRGLNSWDTANMYSFGVSEEIIGKALKVHNIPRNKVILMTKCFMPVGEPGVSFHPSMHQSKDYVNQLGLSRAAIFDNVNQSLERLGTDYIDLFQIHRFDPSTPMEETMKALHDLVQMGKIRYIGASAMWTYQFAQLQFVAEKNGWTKFVSMQNHYNLRYREEEREMNKFCNETGVGLIPFSPNAGGILAKPLVTETVRSQGKQGPPGTWDITPADEEIVARTEKVAREKGWSMSQVAMAWVVQKGAIPIAGFSSIKRLDEGCGIKGKTLTEEEMKYLEEPYVSRAIIGHF